MTEPPLRRASLEPTETNPQDTNRERSLSAYYAPPANHFRHSGWQHDRARVYDAMNRTEQPDSVRINFRECGNHAYVLQSLDDPTHYRVAGSTCHHRFCLPCGQQRSRTIALNVTDRLHGKQARFLTLTLRSTTEPLSELLAKASDSLARLRRTALWSKRVTGGVAFIECKRNHELQRWNVHLHCIIQGRYIKQGLLSQAWKRITRDSLIVDIRLVKDQNHLVRYVTKYASKPLDHSVLHDPPTLDEAIVALKGKRLATTFGDWRGVLLTPKEDESAWTNVGSLNDIIRRAMNGHAESQRIYRSLISETVPLPEPTQSTRAPPAAPTLTGTQMSLTLPPTRITYDAADCRRHRSR